ncbi:hypothetical protein M378DRAFT_14013 [Amanita muscaria Koide BX008]|uniref:Translation machinery-associated protein 22 n=1 Tax=Amanita muscaria (strain Koide BX008) TaxID=946122 RepID=A0A0C2WV41_AMAMK|nr:hypothetical protein M378DRAFT_14013 [Amanita muscaria Koide BX008]
MRKNTKDQKGQPPPPLAPAPSITKPTEPAEPSQSLNHPYKYSTAQRFYSEDALQVKIGTMSLEAQSKLEKDAVEKEAKADAKTDAALKKKLASQVRTSSIPILPQSTKLSRETFLRIKRIERNKRKHVTAIHGLEAFDIDLKKAAKQFASKFATGASVTKIAQGLLCRGM